MTPYEAWVLIRMGYKSDEVNKLIRLCRFQYQNPNAVFYGVGLLDALEDVQSLNTYGQREDRAPESAESEAGASCRGDGEVP